MMFELQTAFAYVFLGILGFGLVCAVCAAVFANRPPVDPVDDNWRDQ